MSGTTAGREPDWRAMPMPEAIAFLRQKVRMPTRRWDDLVGSAHARAFAVAGIQADDMLASIQDALVRSRAEGTGFAQFQRDIGETIARTGWADRGDDYVAWRTRLIYETNVRVAHAAGRYAEMTQPETLEALPYWLYRHNDSRNPRPLHLRWDGTILPATHAWWRTHYAPNGWGCQCEVEPLSERDLRRMKRSGPDAEAPDDGTRSLRDPVTGERQQVPLGVDRGWDYNPGRAWLHGVVPQEMQKPLPPAGPPSRPATGLPPMPPVRPADAARLLPDNLTPEEYAAAFLGEFGATLDQAVVWRDVTGARLTIGHDLFVDTQGRLKSDKRGRGPWMLLLADAMRDPDEVWADWAMVRGQPHLRRRYLRRHGLKGYSNALSVFEWTSEGWLGTTTYPPGGSKLENDRRGVLLYRRPEG
jgi:hypothetical protein